MRSVRRDSTFTIPQPHPYPDQKNLKMAKTKSEKSMPSEAVDENGMKPKSISKSSKAGLKLQVPRINRRIINARVTERVGAVTAIHMTATVEYILRDLITQAATNVQMAGKFKRIKPRDINLTIRSDEDFSRLFAGHRVLSGDKIKTSADEMLVEADKKYNSFVADAAAKAVAVEA